MHLDGERAVWVSDDGRWFWDSETQAWLSLPTSGSDDPPEPFETPPTPTSDESSADDPVPAPDEPVGLDAGLGLDRMWSPPGAKASSRPPRAGSRGRTSRRTRVLVAGIAAVTLTGAALAFLPRGGETDPVAATPAPAHAYSTQAQEGYLRNCRANLGGSKPLCGCSLARFQARYSQEEFVSLQDRFAAKDPTALQQFTAVAAACIPH